MPVMTHQTVMTGMAGYEFCKPFRGTDYMFMPPSTWITWPDT